MAKLTLLLVDIRSAHNVGSIFRTADAFGVDQVICTGITPYPTTPADSRLPHIHNKATAMIAKTALGAERTVKFDYLNDPVEAIDKFKTIGNKIYALEQNAKSVTLNKFRPEYPCVLVLGNEVKGLSRRLLDKCDEIVEIPMQGAKESLNVSVAAGIALYALRA